MRLGTSFAHDHCGTCSLSWLSLKTKAFGRQVYESLMMVSTYWISCAALRLCGHHAIFWCFELPYPNAGPSDLVQEIIRDEIYQKLFLRYQQSDEQHGMTRRARAASRNGDMYTENTRLNRMLTATPGSKTTTADVSGLPHDGVEVFDHEIPNK